MKKITYYNIRVVKATDEEQAINKVMDGKFEDKHYMQDIIATEKGLKHLLLADKNIERNQDWQETHFEIVSYMNDILNKCGTKNIVYKRHEEQGRGGLYELSAELTDKFQKKYSKVNWGEETYWLDTIEKFINKECFKK